ncbi:uncharacterized protein ARMOST_04312 [Armillaria ostoyae]|uniref:Uncharacterized protein n=1 Tax=Armillaria ostoyae TaxID=47428 RepID=A0A284QX02_ARMOS|nr:uncharacterized protein ARMOST_04312 [Armillaria ostoyae]
MVHSALPNTGPFDASGGPKSPGLHASHPHQPRKPSNEAALLLTTTTMTMPPLSTAAAMTMTMTTNARHGMKYSQNPLPTNPSPLAAISVSIAPVYEVHGPSRS